LLIDVQICKQVMYFHGSPTSILACRSRVWFVWMCLHVIAHFTHLLTCRLFGTQ